jgi:hypothetical protein
MTSRSWLATSTLVAALALAACGSDDEPSATSDTTSPAAATPSTSSSIASASATPAPLTPDLDAIGVIGHSGATGADSNGDGQDVPENSWATGDNPDVESVYLRLLGQHPAVAGHNWNEAISGSDVGSLMGQAKAVLGHDPMPDIVLVQSIDNDLRCDGSDEQNLDPFEASVDAVVTYLQTTAPGIKVFFVDQWAAVKAYDDVAEQDPGLVRYLSGSGVCDTFTPDGKRNPKAEAYLQGLVDDYFARIVHVCDQHQDCATDDAAMQELPLELADLTEDYNHLSVSGQAKEAEVAWEQLPQAWK